MNDNNAGCKWASMGTIILMLMFQNMPQKVIGADVHPSDGKVDDARRKFLRLNRPIGYELVQKDDEAGINLTGAANRFADETPLNVLVYALWKYMDDPIYDADAVIILEARLKGDVGSDRGGVDILTYHDVSNPGNWRRESERLKKLCRQDCREMLKEDDDWYPHKVLFDREAVLASSKSNAFARFNYIFAMQKALADPKIRTGNPLEVKDILGLLCEMGASETATNFCDYLFYDWKTATDHRIQEHDKSDQGIYPASSLAAIACLARLGEKCMPQVLDRFANATPEECSMQVGGGGLPILAIRYFYLQIMKEGDAIKKLEDYKKAHANLTKQQVAALDTILDAIKTKKYRPFFMVHSDWAAPKGGVTNAPSVK